MKSHRTKSQEEILTFLKTINRAISAQEIFHELRSRKKTIGLATIYRALDALKLEGSVNVRKLDSGESIYSTVQRDQHHLTCVNCGISLPLDKCPVHDLEVQLETEYMFKVYYHTLEFFGVCNKCHNSPNH
jgi:Fur family ferric uptake transcriptional regulator